MTTTGTKTRHKKVNLPRCFKIHRSYSVKIRQFPVVLWSWSDGKEMYKKAWYTCKVVVLPIEPIASLPFLSPSLLLNLPSESVECSGEYVVMSFASRTTSPYAHAPQELGHREHSIVVNLHERKFLNSHRYSRSSLGNKTTSSPGRNRLHFATTPKCRLRAEMTSEERTKKFYIDDVPLPRRGSGKCFWLVEANFAQPIRSNTQIWHVTSIEFLRSFLRHHLAG